MMMSPGGEYPLHEKFTLSRFSEIVNELKISAARRIMGKIDVKYGAVLQQLPCLEKY